MAPRRVRQRTLENYESAVRRHLVPGIGRHSLDRLRPEHLDQLYTALLGAGYSSASVLRPHQILSRALTVSTELAGRRASGASRRPLRSAAVRTQLLYRLLYVPRVRARRQVREPGSEATMSTGREIGDAL